MRFASARGGGGGGCRLRCRIAVVYKAGKRLRQIEIPAQNLFRGYTDEAIRGGIRIASSAESVLHSFAGTHGDNPSAGVIQGSDGNFYGTTQIGGANHGGTVFKLTPSGRLTTLYSFCSKGGAACTDGDFPYAGVIQGSDGNFYGATTGGGANDGGTVFKLTPSGGLTTLYSFCSQADCTDGDFPYAGVIQGSDGNFYGTTNYGGAAPYGGDGTVFPLPPSGPLTTLYSFCSQADCTDGDFPYAGVIQGSDGNFYGTTNYGGAAPDGDGGTVFHLTPSGALTTLYSFCSQADCTDGDFPYAGVIQGSDGNFYGTAGGGGPNDGGTVFQLTPSGALTTPYSFCSLAGCTDGDF